MCRNRAEDIESSGTRQSRHAEWCWYKVSRRPGSHSLLAQQHTAGTSTRPSSSTVPLPHTRRHIALCLTSGHPLEASKVPFPFNNPLVSLVLTLDSSSAMCRRTRFRYQNCSHEFTHLDKMCDKAEAGEANCTSVVFVEQLEGSCRACREKEEQDAWLADYHAGMEERRQADEARDKANKDQAEKN